MNKNDKIFTSKFILYECPFLELYHRLPKYLDFLFVAIFFRLIDELKISIKIFY